MVLLTLCAVVDLLGQHEVVRASQVFLRFPQVIEGEQILQAVLSVGAYLRLELVVGLGLVLLKFHFPGMAPLKKLC